MTTDILKKINHFDWLKFKTWIDFLISYDSINVYQIWNSVFNKVFWTRNVIFDELMIFDDNIKVVRLELKKIQIVQNMSFDQLIEFLQ